MKAPEKATMPLEDISESTFRETLVRAMKKMERVGWAIDLGRVNDRVYFIDQIGISYDFSHAQDGNVQRGSELQTEEEFINYVTSQGPDVVRLVYQKLLDYVTKEDFPQRPPVSRYIGEG